MADVLYGRNAVREALRARRRSFGRLFVSSGAQEAGTLGEGVALECGEYPYAELSDCLTLAEERREPVLLLLLDHLQDPQNVGTLLRTAETVGVHGVVLPGRRAAEVTPAVVNASSGATEHLRIVVV